MKNKDGLYDEYASLVYKYLYRLTGDYDLAEELTQEVFYQALRTSDNYKGDSKVSTWLCQIAKYCWYKYLQKQSKEKHVSLEDLPDYLSDDTSPERIVLEKEGKVFLYKRIHLLNEPYREIVLLRILGELSFSEIADVMGKTENWARVTFHRAKIIMIGRGIENGG